ncbi:hypothetical protein D3C85_1692840 [compost metagenome]
MDGTTLINFTLPAKSDNVAASVNDLFKVKAGALSPALSSGPINVMGLPLSVATPVRSCAIIVIPPWKSCL